VLALVLDNSLVRLQRGRDRPLSGDGLVRVRTRIGGICNTDLELARGYMGFEGVLGHEFVGEALDGQLAGARVVGGINFSCHDCATCRGGNPRHCPRRTVLGIQGADGVFAEEFLIPERNLSLVPDGVSDEQAVFTEPLAAACQLVAQLAGEVPPTALVMGDGKLGLLLAQVLAANACRVELVGRHLDKLGWLRDSGVSLVEELQQGKTWPLVVEATGSREGLEAALQVTSPRGTLVLKTTVEGSHELNLAPVVINEITILGSRCGAFEPALELLERGLVQTDPMIGGRYGLDDGEKAFERAACRGAGKILIEVG